MNAIKMKFSAGRDIDKKLLVKDNNPDHVINFHKMSEFFKGR